MPAEHAEWMEAEVRVLKRKERESKKALLVLLDATGAFLEQFAATMKQPESKKRNKTIIELFGELNIARDRARYFALNIDFRTDSLDTKYKSLGCYDCELRADKKTDNG